MPAKDDRLPTFVFNVNDWLTSKAVVAMTLEEQGGYVRLLCYAWLNDEPGVLEYDAKIFAGLLAMSSEEWQRHAPAIGRAWDQTSRPGFWINARMVDEREKQLKYLSEQSRKGSLGASKRWNAIDNPVVWPGHSQRLTENSGVGVGVGDSRVKDTPNPTADAVGPRVSLAREPENTNGRSRERGENPRALGTNPRAQKANPREKGTNPRRANWRPRKWYGTPRTEKLPAWYKPPGPLSLSPAGYTGIELPGPKVWRELNPDELREWQAAMMGSEPE